MAPQINIIIFVIAIAGAEGFVTIKTGSTALPGDLTLTFNAMGAVISCSSTAGS